ncbi:hypothetical protein IG631_02543 [Alternaria alternata]|nr:hypothetical protein IG631_02543 [Alternaria alternata]
MSFDCRFKLIDFELTHFSAGSELYPSFWLRDAHGVQTYSAPECFRSEHDGFDERTTRPATPSKDVFSLGCVFSEAFVWSALGAEGVEKYRLERRAATEQIGELERTAYSGCFHDGKQVLAAVASMHAEARNNYGQDFPFMGKLSLIIEDMLSDVSIRPPAHEVRKRLMRVINDDMSIHGVSGAGFKAPGFGRPPE